MRVKVGKTITLRGTRFSSRRKGNAVVFRGSNGRSAFAKPVRASRTKIVVKVPGSSAKDLNLRAVPYPGKRPYPNPLDPSDVGIDFDGDSLTTKEEYRAWVYTGKKFDQSNPDSSLGYSDGTQSSRPTEQPAVPAFRSAQYGIPFSPPDYPARLDTDGDGRYTDDERDADADGMNNYVESHGPGHADWWTTTLAAEGVTPWPDTYYGAFTQRPFADLALDDPDADGDTLLDGEDDQDNDGWTNIDEMYNRGVNTSSGPRNTNAFNPCAPETSRTCPRYQPVN